MHGNRQLGNLCAGAWFCSGDSTADNFLIVKQFCVRKCGLLFAFFVSVRPFSGLQRHYALCGASRLRCWYRFTSAKAAHSHWWFFQIPR